MSNDIEQIPTNQLVAELKRREDARKPQRPPPKAMKDVDWRDVYELAQKYAAWVEKDAHDDGRSDWKNYIYEAVLGAVFGKDFWPWSNSRFG